jgi:hypothetical protein
MNSEQCDAINHWFLKLQGVQRFQEYLTETGLFGNRDSHLREKARQRRDYLKKLRTKYPKEEFLERLKGQRKVTFPVSDTDNCAPAATLSAVSFDSSEPSSVEPPPPNTMSHLDPQRLPPVNLDFVHCERNGGLIPIQTADVAYANRRLTVWHFALPILDPRTFNEVTVKLTEDKKGFIVRQPIVPTAFIDMDEREAFVNYSMDRRPTRLTHFDTCSMEEATNLMEAFSTNFLAFGAKFDQSLMPATRFTTQIFYFPAGQMGSTSFFGNSVDNIKLHLHVNEINFGRNNASVSHLAYAEFMIARDQEMEQIVTEKKWTQDEELEWAMAG